MNERTKELNNGILPQRSSKKNGYALLMALLVTTTIVAGATALSRVVLSNLRQSQLVDRAAVAKIAASSGLEQGLFLVRRLERVPIPGGVIEFDNASTGDPAVSVSMRINDDLSVASRFAIPKDDSIVLDIPSDVNVNLVNILAWTPAEGCIQSWIETALSSWGDDGFSTNRRLYSQGGGQVTLDLATPVGVPKQLRIKALYCDIERLDVLASSGGNTVPLPARVVIDSVGEYLGSRQALRAVLPARPPLSGVFDFVLYSGSEINKGN